MTLRFDSTKRFEKELEQFASEEKSGIIEKLNRYCMLIESDPAEFYKKAFQPVKPELTDDESTLYSLRINRDTGIVMAVDAGPLFEQTIITLFHVVTPSDLEKAFRSVAESLY